MAKMKACKDCGKEVSKSAKTCPNCGAKIGSLGKIIAIFILIIGIIAFIGSMNNLDGALDDITYPYPDSKDVQMTLNQFNEIETGMTEDEVWGILGGKCTSTGVTDLGVGEEYKTEGFGCNGKGTTGANAILMFQGGKLNTKSQHGLK